MTTGWHGMTGFRGRISGCIKEADLSGLLRGLFPDMRIALEDFAGCFLL
jgi:hypothetical protein